MPQCQVPPRSPSMTTFVDGKRAKTGIVAVICESTGGHPSPDLSISIGDDVVTESSHTFKMQEHLDGNQVSCGATNVLSESPIYSPYRTIYLTFGPSEVYLNGPEVVTIGDTAQFFCSSSQAFPQPSLQVSVTDEDGNKVQLVNELQHPKMKGEKGFVARLDFGIQVETGNTGFQVVCSASNGWGSVSHTAFITVQYPPSTIEITGPSNVSEDEEFDVSCITSPSYPPSNISWDISNDGINFEIIDDDDESREE